MKKAAPKAICPRFECRSAGNVEARICCKYNTGHTWKIWAKEDGTRDHLDRRNEYYKEHCCGDYRGCETFKLLEAK